jgi:heat shock protein HslJ
MVLAIAAAAALAGCSTTTGQAQAHGPGAIQAATTSDSLAQTQWRLVQWTSRDGSSRTLPTGQDQPLSLVFLAQGRDYRVSGYGGCNEFSGTYRLQAGKLTITVPSARRVSCPSPELDATERAYLSSLGHIVSFTLDSGGAPRQMALNVQNGDVLTFKRGADVPTNR